MRCHPSPAIFPVLMALVLVTSPLSPLSATTLTVDAQPGYTAGVRVVGVAPIDCTRQLDCTEIEKKVAQALRGKTGWRVIGAEEVAEEMDPWGDRELLPGNVAALAQDLGADAILTIALLPAGSAKGFEPRWSPLNPKGLSFHKSLLGKKEAVQVHLLSAETGEVLLEGTAVGKALAGKSTRRTLRELIALIEKAFGE